MFLAHGEELSAADVNTLLEQEYRRINNGDNPPPGFNLRRYFIDLDPSGNLSDTVSVLVATRS